MNRRSFLGTLAAGGALFTAGCAESVGFADSPPDPSAVFEDYRFDGPELLVRFREGVTVERAVLFDSATDEEYGTVDRPTVTVRFPVVFPDRFETYVSRSLHVKAETPDGWTSEWIPETVHATTRNVELLRDGRARFEVENVGGAPLLVRFVGIYGDIPNPTVDPQSESFDRSSFDLGPGVVGVGSNRPLSPSRTDLVVSPGETVPFETTYAPFAFPDGAEPNACGGGERTARIAVVHASGGSASYTFSYRLKGEPSSLPGGTAEVCSDPATSAIPDVHI